jgi:SAM-dependent methyltransferase
MDRLVGYFVGCAATHLIRLGVDTGLWESLAARCDGISASALGDQLGLSDLYIDHFLRSAAALQLVEVEPASGAYRLAPHMGILLGRPGDYRYMGSLAHLYILGCRDFDRMDELLRSGATHSYLEHDVELYDAVACASEGLAEFLVRAVIRRLPGLRGREDAAVLDIGCGQGAAVLSLAEAFPKGRVLGIDVEPHSVQRATARIAAAGLEDRASARLMGAEELSARAEFDLVTLVQVLHETDPTARGAILRAAHEALVPGGSLVVIDEPYPDDLASLGSAPAAVLTQFIEIFWGSLLISPAEQRQLVEEAGFRIVSQMLPAPGLICVTIAEKG